MADITHVHDVDIYRRAVPKALGGDYRDNYLSEDSLRLDTNYGTETLALSGVDAPEKAIASERRLIALYDLNKFLPGDVMADSSKIVSADWWFYIQTTTGAGSFIWYIKRCGRTDWEEDKACWASYGPVADSGTAESGTFYTLTDTDKSWTPDEWIGFRLYITGGTGNGQGRDITDNTGTVLTVPVVWNPIPDSSSTYEIRTPWAVAGGDPQEPSYNIGNLLDGGTGWHTETITGMVTDAIDNRSGLLSLVLLRDDIFPDTDGLIDVKTKDTTLKDAPHVRITYTLAGKTFQAHVR